MESIKEPIFSQGKGRKKSEGPRESLREHPLWQFSSLLSEWEVGGMGGKYNRATGRKKTKGKVDLRLVIKKWRLNEQWSGWRGFPSLPLRALKSVALIFLRFFFSLLSTEMSNSPSRGWGRVGAFFLKNNQLLTSLFLSTSHSQPRNLLPLPLTPSFLHLISN